MNIRDFSNCSSWQPHFSGYSRHKPYSYSNLLTLHPISRSSNSKSKYSQNPSIFTILTAITLVPALQVSLAIVSLKISLPPSQSSTVASDPSETHGRCSKSSLGVFHGFSFIQNKIQSLNIALQGPTTSPPPL